MARPTKYPRVVSWSCRAYSLLIWAYPSGLRSEYRGELLLTFRNQIEDVVNSGSASLAACFVMHIAVDWIRTLALEHEEPEDLSLLGLTSAHGQARGSLDTSMFTSSLMLATLGVALLIGGWIGWFRMIDAIVNHHRTAAEAIGQGVLPSW